MNNNNNANRFVVPTAAQTNEIIGIFVNAESPQELAAFFDDMRDAHGMRASARLKDGVAGVMALGRYRNGDSGHIWASSASARAELDVSQLKVLFDNMSKATMGAALVAIMKYHGEDKKALVLAKELVERERRGVSPNAPDFSNGKRTALHYARRVSIVEYLIAAGANVNARDAFGLTPLHMMHYTSPAKIKALIDAGANVNARDAEGRTPLFFYPSGPDIIKMLIRAGANPNLKNKKGDTPLRFLLKRIESSAMARTPPKVAETIEILMTATNAKPSDIGNVKIANLPSNIRNVISKRAKEGTMRFVTTAKAVGNRLNPDMSMKILRQAFG